MPVTFRAVIFFMILLLVTVGLLFPQDSTTLHDKRGKKISCRILRDHDGLTRVLIKTKRKYAEFHNSSGSAEEIQYASFGKAVIDDYSEALGLKAEDVRFDQISTESDSSKEVSYEQVYGAIRVLG